MYLLLAIWIYSLFKSIAKTFFALLVILKERIPFSHPMSKTLEFLNIIDEELILIHNSMFRMNVII